MRILFLTHTFNGLAQRLYVALTARGHEVSVELDIADSASIEAVRLFAPDVILAPFLKRMIPEELWRRHVCLVVHPGIRGDRGPSSLDWAILEGVREWGVTVLQANAVPDGGDVWAERRFALPRASKSSVYRNQITEASCEAVLESIDKLEGGCSRPEPVDYSRPEVGGRPRPPMRQAVRRIDWARDDTATVLAKIRSGDGFPGVVDEIGGRRFRLFDARPERVLRGPPGALLATRHGAICRATLDAAVWIGHLQADPGGGAGSHGDESANGERNRAARARRLDRPTFKLPATLALGETDGGRDSDALRGVPDQPLPTLPARDDGTWQDIFYEEALGVGFLHFGFYNGAMSTGQCLRLCAAFREAARRPTRALVLCGGPDFWSNGIHLNVIEAASSPADESWANINAMDDLCLEILGCTDKLTVAAMQGNAGAGGVFLALTADRAWARSGIVLNPHYKNMGNLFGSEYWTYLLPKRVGVERAQAITRSRLPMGTAEAVSIGLLDERFGSSVDAFLDQVRRRAVALANDPGREALLAAKRARRRADESVKPLAAYRADELARMRLNFYGFDPSYHVARHHFVHRVPHGWTPLHLAPHRRRMWSRQALLANRIGALPAAPDTGSHQTDADPPGRAETAA